MRPAFPAARVYVLPSYREGTPRTVLKAMAMAMAMAMGRPILTADAPGCRETVVEVRNGFLVPVRDVDALAAALALNLGAGAGRADGAREPGDRAGEVRCAKGESGVSPCS